MDLSKEDILHAGAYRVCLERFDPDNCISATLLKFIDEQAVKIAEWADTQNADIKQAYIRAIKDVRQRAADRLENQERAMACLDAYAVIPKPPEK